MFNAGDGSDRLSDTPGEGNRLLFGPGISVSSVTLGLGTGDSLLVRTGVAGDAIQILENLEGTIEPAIDALEFADGTTLSIEELLARGIEITGTAGPDTLTGTNLIDRISGGAGNDFIVGGLGADILRGEEESDQLFGSDGDDQLNGGTGNDVLNGEAGQDTYVFGRGYGQDSLRIPYRTIRSEHDPTHERGQFRRGPPAGSAVRGRNQCGADDQWNGGRTDTPRRGGSQPAADQPDSLCRWFQLGSRRDSESHRRDGHHGVTGR